MEDFCPSISKILERYFDREVTAREKELAEAHLRECRSCRARLESMEQVRGLLAIPAQDHVREDDFARVFMKVKRELRSGRSQSWWETLRSWVLSYVLVQKKVWIPAVAAVILLLAVTPFLLKENPSYPGATVVEYIESDTNNVMIYESEKGNATVIWLIDETEPSA